MEFDVGRGIRFGGDCARAAFIALAMIMLAHRNQYRVSVFNCLGREHSGN